MTHEANQARTHLDRWCQAQPQRRCRASSPTSPMIHSQPSVIAAWALICLSGAFEILFSGLLKQSDGFTRPIPSTIAVIAALLSIWLMTISLRTLALGPAYAVWAGIGTLGTRLRCSCFALSDVLRSHDTTS